jgi:hypothetical protein
LPIFLIPQLYESQSAQLPMTLKKTLLSLWARNHIPKTQITNPNAPTQTMPLLKNIKHSSHNYEIIA